jgi:HD-like signal output (HDOD) protein
VVCETTQRPGGWGKAGDTVALILRTLPEALLGEGREPSSPSVSRQTIERKMRHVQEFGTIPALLKRLLEVLGNPYLSLEEIAAVVSKDQVLAGQLLKTANSAFFGFTSRVASIKQALLLLGVNAAKGLLLGVSLFHHVRGIEGLWAHSVGTASVAAVIARRQALTDHAEVFAAGLLHDVGKVFLVAKFSPEYRRALSLAQERGTLIVDAEREIFDATHTEAAAWALEHWHLPSQLIEPIRYHHEPSLATMWCTETAVVHVADILTRARGFGSGGDALVPLIDQMVWAQLHLSTAEVEAILAESEAPLKEAQSFLSFP